MCNLKLVDISKDHWHLVKRSPKKIKHEFQISLSNKKNVQLMKIYISHLRCDPFEVKFPPLY